MSVTCDWRGRYIPKSKFVSLAGVYAADLLTIGALFLTSVSVAESQDKNRFNVDGAFYHLCPSQESFQLELFSFIDESLKACIANSVMSLATCNHRSMMHANRF